jgi:outer membrane protein OmpA-like peptidoglycan-associated protein
MRQLLCAMAIVVTGIGSTACATKNYVNTRVDDVNTDMNAKVATLSESIEETQERTRANATRIGEVDQKADAAASRADAANARAGEAGTAAERAATAAATVDTKVQAMDAASRRLVYEVVLSDENSKFGFGQSSLAAEAKAEVDKVVQQLTADPKNVFLEIEGHTDSTGSDTLNDRLGLERAEAVKRYLYEQHSIPLHKMNVISYGESKPVAPNTTRDGRAMNRRVVIKVLS